MTFYPNKYVAVTIDGASCCHIVCYANDGHETGRILIDASDISTCQQYRWHVEYSKKREVVYGAASIKGRTIRIHRLLLNPQENMQVDHINHNGLDNRRCNLRICNNRDNNCNKNFAMAKRASKLSTGIRILNGRYYARIMVHKKEIALGGYNSLHEAVEARRKAEKEYFGEYRYAEIR